MTSRIFPFVAAITAALALLVSAQVDAHGAAKPKHGGIVQTASDLSFELVSLQDGAALYIEDHGVPMSPSKLSGKLTVLNGEQKTDVDLKATAARFEAKGLKLASGAKVVAVLTTEAKKTITVRFAIK